MKNYSSGIDCKLPVCIKGTCKIFKGMAKDACPESTLTHYEQKGRRFSKNINEMQIHVYTNGDVIVECTTPKYKREECSYSVTVTGPNEDKTMEAILREIDRCKNGEKIIK
jgi:hypothetical protein